AALTIGSPSVHHYIRWNLGNTATTTTTLVYDNNGNLTAYGTANGTTTYTWDYHNRLLTIASSTTSTFNYDHTGDRARFYAGTSHRTLALMSRVSLFSLINFTKKISLKH